LPRAVRIQFGPEYLKAVPVELPEEPAVEAVAETVVEKPNPSPKKKAAVAVEEPLVDYAEQEPANVSDN
jgi:hypothetical protein